MRKKRIGPLRPRIPKPRTPQVRRRNQHDITEHPKPNSKRKPVPHRNSRPTPPHARIRNPKPRAKDIVHRTPSNGVPEITKLQMKHPGNAIHNRSNRLRLFIEVIRRTPRLKQRSNSPLRHIHSKRSPNTSPNRRTP